MQIGHLIFAEAFQETTSALGPIDIVVNNAGIMNDRFWELEVDTNLVSTYLFFNLIENWEYICYVKQSFN